MIKIKGTNKTFICLICVNGDKVIINPEHICEIDVVSTEEKEELLITMITNNFYTITAEEFEKKLVALSLDREEQSN